MLILKIIKLFDFLIYLWYNAKAISVEQYSSQGPLL